MDKFIYKSLDIMPPQEILKDLWVFADSIDSSTYHPVKDLHVTLLFHTQNNSKVAKVLEWWESRPYETYIPIEVTHIGKNDKAVALKVNLLGLEHEYVCANAAPHITIGTFNGGKPVDSNSIIEWKELPTHEYAVGRFNIH